MKMVPLGLGVHWNDFPADLDLGVVSSRHWNDERVRSWKKRFRHDRQNHLWGHKKNQGRESLFYYVLREKDELVVRLKVLDDHGSVFLWSPFEVREFRREVPFRSEGVELLEEPLERLLREICTEEIICATESSSVHSTNTGIDLPSFCNRVLIS